MKRLASAALPIAILAGSGGPAGAVIQTTLPQLLFTSPSPAPAPAAPAPLPPPTNPGYAPAPPNGLSPILSQPGPVYELPQATNPPYPPPELPGPIDQQKIQSYRNDLRARQWQGLSPGSERSREIQRQLDAPDPQ